jgi:hypothetical protein
MAFPGGAPVGLPPGMDPNAGMNEQERQMVKYVCIVPRFWQAPFRGLGRFLWGIWG